MSVYTLYVVVEGGVASVRYDGPTDLHPGDAVRVELRDYDIDGSEESALKGNAAEGYYVGGVHLRLNMHG